VIFLYAPRRVHSPRYGVVVELLPWAAGKSPITTSFAWFIASWAKVLSWTETARRFGISPHVVFDAVKRAVDWGRQHQNLEGIISIGVDELSRKKGHRYLTVVYQIDHHRKRLLWIGRDRTARSFENFFDWLGQERCKLIGFVASDMWAAFLGTVARRACGAVQVLDRFHVMQLFSQAVEEVRRDEARKLRERGDRITLDKTSGEFLLRCENIDLNAERVLQLGGGTPIVLRPRDYYQLLQRIRLHVGGECKPHKWATRHDVVRPFRFLHPSNRNPCGVPRVSQEVPTQPC
jgi:transposase